MQPHELRKIFVDIVNGYSYSSVVKLYIKHATLQEEVICDAVKEDAIKKAISYGLKTEAQILEECYKDGRWPQSKINALKQLEKDYKALSQSRFSPISELQLEALREEFKLMEQEWIKLTKEKSSLFINSAERFGERASNDYFVGISLFKDSTLIHRAFDVDDFDYLDDDKFAKITKEINKVLSLFTYANISELAIQPFFQQRISISDRLFDFLGKPTCQLTEHQINLLKIGEKFKYMLENCGEIPEDYSDTPDGIEDYYYLKKANVLKTNEEIAAQRSKWL